MEEQTNNYKNSSDVFKDVKNLIKAEGITSEKVENFARDFIEKFKAYEKDGTLPSKENSNDKSDVEIDK